MSIWLACTPCQWPTFSYTIDLWQTQAPPCGKLPLQRYGFYGLLTVSR